MVFKKKIEPRFSSKNMRKVTMQTLLMLDGYIRDGDAVIDVGCGNGYVLWQLSKRYNLSDAVGVDAVDIRRAPVPEFMLYDGLHIPVEDRRFNVAMLNFVLHHIPNDKKEILIREVR